MPRRCSVELCYRNSSNTTKSAFFKFPNDNVLREAWIAAMNQKGFYPSRTSTLCSRHFSPESLIKTLTGRLMVKKGVVPDIFPSKASDYKKEILISTDKSSSGVPAVNSSSPTTPTVTQATIPLNSSSLSDETSLVQNSTTPISSTTSKTSHQKDGSCPFKSAGTIPRKISLAVKPVSNLLIRGNASSIESSFEIRSSSSTVIPSSISLPTPLKLHQHSSESGLSRSMLVNLIPAIAYKDS